MGLAARGMLVCDLDGTLIGEDAASRRFTDWWRQHGDGYRLVYASGRYYASAVAAYREAGLPEPAAVIADVGTDIRIQPAGTPLIEWASRWWCTFSMDRVRQVLDGHQALTLQPAECQSEFKRSYYLRQDPHEHLRQFRQRFRSERVAVDLIYSSERDLDVVPADVNKGTATEFLAREWNVPKSRVVVAGDSGNDGPLFTQGFRGVIVANAQPELRCLEGTNLYRSPFGHADGVLDGFRFWQERRTCDAGSRC